MGEDMLFDTGSCRAVAASTFLRMKRSHNVDTYFFRHYILSPTDMFYSADYHLIPPNINKFLILNLDGKKREILDHAHKIETLSEQWDETEKHTKELGEILSIDPRLIDALDYEFLLLMVDFLSHKQKPKLQSGAITIIQHCISNRKSRFNQVVARDIRESIIEDLVRSDDIELKTQALCLFGTIVGKIPKQYVRGFSIPVLDIITLPIYDSTVNEEFLCGVSMTLAIICQRDPELVLLKLPEVCNTLNKLFKCSRVDILAYACMGLGHLCEETKAVVFNKTSLLYFVHQLIKIMRCLYEPKNRPSSIAALVAFGAIIRWGSDDDIKIIIEGSEALHLLRSLLHKPDKHYVGNACRIISNITAGKENHIKAVIDFGLIDNLFHVVQNYKLIDVKKEAAWAISNAMYGVGSNQIEVFSNSCIKPLWDILKVSLADQEIISFCLEGLVSSEEVKVFYNGKPINALELKKYLGTLRGGQFQSELKKPWDDMDNKSLKDSFSFCYDTGKEIVEDGMEFYLAHTVKDSALQPGLKVCLLYKSSKEEEDSSNLMDLMEIDEPEENLCILF